MVPTIQSRLRHVIRTPIGTFEDRYWEKTPSQEQFYDAVRYWSNRLMLGGFKIETNMVAADWFIRNRDDGKYEHGLCERQERGCYARIYVRDPESWFPPDSILPHDWERTLVHELLHLVLLPVCPGESGPEEELVITRLTEAFLDGHRTPWTEMTVRDNPEEA
jgi:hypothetical protein